MISYGEFEERLIVCLYEDEQEGALNGSSLRELCERNDLPLLSDYQVRFVNENQTGGDVIGEGSGFSPDHLCFALNGKGREKALELIHHQKSKTLAGKIINVERSDWIALGAFGVSLIALFK